MTFRAKYLVYGAALVGFVLLPQLITVKYYLHLSVLALVWVIAAQGQNLIQGYTGYVSIVQAGFMGIGAYSTTLLGLHYSLPVWLTILLAPVITALFALFAFFGIGVLLGWAVEASVGEYRRKREEEIRTLDERLQALDSEPHLVAEVAEHPAVEVE